MHCGEMNGFEHNDFEIMLYSIFGNLLFLIASSICALLTSIPVTCLKYGESNAVLWPDPQPISNAWFKYVTQFNNFFRVKFINIDQI